MEQPTRFGHGCFGRRKVLLERGLGIAENKRGVVTIHQTMLRIRPFHALRPAGNRAALVSCPPPDQLPGAVPNASDETNAASPQSFQHVVCASSARDAAAVVQRLVESGALFADPEPHVYVYRISRDGHRLFGIVACIECADLDGHTARETAAPWREPAVAQYDDDEQGTIASMAVCDMNERPIFHFNAGDGTTHTAWLAHDSARYVAAFAALAGRARLVVSGATAGDGRVLAVLLDRSHVSAGACGADHGHPVPRCGLFVQRSVLVP